MFEPIGLALSLALAQSQPSYPPPITRVDPPAVALPMRAQPVNPLGDYLSEDDYPAVAIRYLEEGVVGYRLSIDEDGFVSGCDILQSSGSVALDAATCRIMRSRPRFIPARDQDGRAVPDTLSSRIRWVLPEEDPAETAANAAAPGDGEDEAPEPVIQVPPPPPVIVPYAPRVPGMAYATAALPTHPYAFYFTPADYPAAARQGRLEGLVAFQLTIAATGRVTACAITASSGSPLLDAATCRILRLRARYVPARNLAGQPVTGSDRGIFRWRLPED